MSGVTKQLLGDTEMAKQRQWGYPTRVDKKGRVVEINLYLYEKVELARHNIKQLSNQLDKG